MPKKKTSFYQWCIENDKKHLLDEFDKNKNIINPTEVSYGSNKKVFWIDSFGMSWEAPIFRRTIYNGRSPYEDGKLPVPGINDLGTTHPEIALQFHTSKNYPLTVEQLKAASNKKIWWKCHLNHSYESVVYSKTSSRPTGCPFCESRKLLEGLNDLATINPKLASEWHPTKNGDLKPNQVFPFSNRKVWWTCEHGHEWEATINSRKTNRCPHCYQDHRVSVREKLVFVNLKKYFEDALPNFEISDYHKISVDIYIPSLRLVIEYDGTQYHQDVEKDNRRLSIINGTGNDVIRIREPGLPVIEEGQTIILKSVKFTDVAKGTEKLLELISEKYNLQLPIASIDADKDLPEVYKLIEFSLVENSLQSVFPEIAKEWNHSLNGNLNPDRITAHSSLKVYWTCPLGHDYQATVNNRSNGKGCSYCSGKKVLVGFNDLLSQRPEIARQWDDEKNHLRPEEATAFSHKKVWWKCRHGRSWKAAINARKTDGCKCK